MPPEMKEELRMKRESREIYQRLHAKRRSKFPEPKRNVLVIPEEYTGTNLKRCKRLIAKRMKQETKEMKKRLESKKIVEINAIAKKLKLPLRGNKRERINILVDYFKMPGYWKTIIHG